MKKRKLDYEIKYRLPISCEWIAMKKSNEHKSELSQYLLSAMQMQNIIVLAGSGTSISSTKIKMGPSMNDLWEVCTKNKQTKEIFSILEYPKEDEEFKNIEILLSHCEALLQIKESDVISDFVKSCKQKIVEKCSFEKNEVNLEGHRTFIHRLSRRRTRDSRLQIFTTNYDTCFEEAAGYNGIVVIDGFSFTNPRQYDPRFFDFDIVRRGAKSNSADMYLEGVFKLYKLHGSVNWQREDSHIYEKKASPEKACMIFPARGKYQQSYIQPHLEIMGRYLAALRESNTCLIVSGFGFNDDHLSEPIISAIKTNPQIKVIIADYKAQENIEKAVKKNSNKWRELEKLSHEGEDITFVNASFSDFAKLIPDLSSLTPAERMAEAIRSVAGDNQ